MERRLQDKHEEVMSLEHKENARLEQQKAEVLEKKRKEVSNVVMTSQLRGDVTHQLTLHRVVGIGDAQGGHVEYGRRRPKVDESRDEAHFR